jgi:serine/threonine protein kinase/lipoprotein NlpI
MAQIISGRYKLENLIGRGSMAEVYRATDLIEDRIVAVKIPHAESEMDLERIRREAELSMNLRHPSIVEVYDVVSSEGKIYIVMEYVDGVKLSQMIAESGGIPIAQALDISIQICEALSCAHQAGILHRDIKPDNIMLNREGKIKVMDFGLAERVDLLNSALTGEISGTVLYISPEQALGDELDRRADLYSFGVVMYEILTGEPPFKGENALTLIYQHLDEPPPPLKELNPVIPAELEEVVLKLLEKEPGSRYNSADELRKILERLKRDIEEGKLRVEPPEEVEEKAPRYMEMLSEDERKMLKHLPVEEMLRYVLDAAEKEKGEERYQDALNHYQVAVEILNEIGELEEAKKADILCEIAWIHSHITGDLSEALETYHQALAICERLGERRKKAEIFKEIGTIHSIRGEWEISNEAYHESMALFRDLGDLHEVGNIYSNLGINYFEEGNWDLAIENCQQAIEIAERLGYTELLADSNQLMGAIYSERKQWDEAISYYGKALQGFKELKDPRRIAHTNLNMGVAYSEMGMDKEAEEHFMRSEEIARQLGETRLLAFVYMNRAELKSSSEPERARELCGEALSIMRQTDDRPGLAEVYRVYGLVYTSLGEWKLAEQFFENSISIYEENNNKVGIAKVYQHMSEMFRRRGMQSEALSFKRQAQELLRELGVE